MNIKKMKKKAKEKEKKNFFSVFPFYSLQFLLGSGTQGTSHGKEIKRFLVSKANMFQSHYSFVFDK